MCVVYAFKRGLQRNPTLSRQNLLVHTAGARVVSCVPSIVYADT